MTIIIIITITIPILQAATPHGETAEDKKWGKEQSEAWFKELAGHRMTVTPIPFPPPSPFLSLTHLLPSLVPSSLHIPIHIHAP
jgi:hypothetical protein